MIWGRALLALLSISVSGALAAQTEQVPGVTAEIESAREACEGLGVFELHIDQVVKNLPDLNGDERADIAVDHSGFICHGAYSVYGGTAGTPLVIFISGDDSYSRFQFYARSWRTVEHPGERGADAILVISVHGTACGGVGADPCFAALTWSGSELFSIGKP